MLVPKLKAPKGYIRLNETSYDKLVNYHFDNGFCILTAFRSEFTMAENRARNKKLAADLKANGLGFIRVTGGYREIIDKDNVNWDDAEKIPDNDEKRLLTIMEESLLVPNFDIKTKKPFDDFDKLKDIIIDLGIKYEQDSVLISPPHSGGNAYYVITNERYGDLGDIDMKFDKMDLASITDTYFSSLSKTINKLKVKRGDGVGGFKFEKLKYVCTFVDEPRHTLSGMRSENASGSLPVFGSHYYGVSTLVKKQLESTAERSADVYTIHATKRNGYVSDTIKDFVGTLEELKKEFNFDRDVTVYTPTDKEVTIKEPKTISDLVKALNRKEKLRFSGISKYRKVGFTIYELM